MFGMEYYIVLGFIVDSIFKYGAQKFKHVKFLQEPEKNVATSLSPMMRITVILKQACYL